jgi:hypothetical protein
VIQKLVQRCFEVSHISKILKRDHRPKEAGKSRLFTGESLQTNNDAAHFAENHRENLEPSFAVSRNRTLHKSPTLYHPTRAIWFPATEKL